MREILVTALVAFLVIVTFGGSPVSLGDDQGSEEGIGRYERISDSGDLREEHVSQVSNGLEVTGPIGTDTLRVRSGFIEEDLGAGWAADREFSLQDDLVVVESESVVFSELEIGSDPVFTMGSPDEVEFQERPMWVSIKQEDWGDTLTLEMDDGDTSGQEVFIAKEWLGDRGIHKPNVTHEDGSFLEVTRTPGGEGFLFEMHHFTYVEINPPELEVKGRQDGVVFPHVGERRWHEEEDRLEVDVEEKLSDYDVLVEKDWVDVNIPFPSVEVYDYHEETVDGEDYYVVPLQPGQTPTEVVFRDWHLDLETGAIWRELSQEEYEASLWSAEDGVYATKNPGSLTDFESSGNVTIKVAIEGVGRNLTFSHRNTSSSQVYSEDVGLPGSSPGVDELYNATIHTYQGVESAGDELWIASKEEGKGFSATGEDEGIPIRIIKNSPDFGLGDLPVDAVLVMAMGMLCDGADGEQCSPPGVPGQQCEALEGESGACSESVEKYVYYGGELDWCHEQGRDNWVSQAKIEFERGEEAFGPTAVKLLAVGYHCWFVKDGSEPDHDTDYVHRHSDGSQHDYPYNDIEDDHECNMYLGRVSNSFDHINKQPHNREWRTPHKYQVLHWESCGTEDDPAGGRGDIDGPHSIATPNSRNWATSHELGHNFNAIHSEAECLPTGEVTLMAEKWNPSCSDGTEERLNVFSADNKERIDENVLPDIE